MLCTIVHHMVKIKKIIRQDHQKEQNKVVAHTKVSASLALAGHTHQRFQLALAMVLSSWHLARVCLRVICRGLQAGDTQPLVQTLHDLSHELSALVRQYG